ncbi:MAG: hypothetical protein H7Y11_01190 [Armatimonadetes bacterium]|nr:hypothetical protein [Anaerolineae bacterium]
MGYYMRFIVIDAQAAADGLTLDAVEAALQAHDPAYALANRQTIPYTSADLFYRDEVYAELELNQPGDDLFDDEVAELVEELESIIFDHPDDQATQQALAVQMRMAQTILVARVVFGDNALEDGIRHLEPLWAWLFSLEAGVLLVDYEGYYDGQGLLLGFNASE